MRIFYITTFLKEKLISEKQKIGNNGNQVVESCTYLSQQDLFCWRYGFCGKISESKDILKMKDIRLTNKPSDWNEHKGVKYL